jgi:DNA gyrase subunit A
MLCHSLLEFNAKSPLFLPSFLPLPPSLPFCENCRDTIEIPAQVTLPHRYTECRLKQLAQDVLLADLHPSIVSFTPNFDGSCEEPSVLPSRIPLLLVNGSQGIAVGIATRIPPHNLVEVVEALKALIQDPNLSNEQLHEFVLGPDFPTGGIILGGPGIRSIYGSGRGSVTVRSRIDIEPSHAHSGRDVIVVSELPYQVYKAAVISDIAKLVDDGTVQGVADIQDESDRRCVCNGASQRRVSQPLCTLTEVASAVQMRSIPTVE